MNTNYHIDITYLSVRHDYVIKSGHSDFPLSDHRRACPLPPPKSVKVR